MSDDEIPPDIDDDAQGEPELAVAPEPEPGPLDPWAAIRLWASAMLASPPDGIVPMRKAFDELVGLTDGDVEIGGPWLDNVEIAAFHMHVRPQRMAPEVLRAGHLDEEGDHCWYRAPRYPVGAPQNRLWLGVTRSSLDLLLERVRNPGAAAPPQASSAGTIGPESPAQPQGELGTEPAAEADGLLRCRLCGHSSHGHWLLLSLGGRLVQVCIGCAREVASAVRRK